MTRAQEKAIEEFPIVRDLNLRNAYISGYHQAEKDLADAFQAEYAKELARADFALTIEDIELLHTFLYAIKNNKHGCFTFTRLSDEQYEEVLRRFREMKKEQTEVCPLH
jgi:hypothetical protein